VPRGRNREVRMEIKSPAMVEVVEDVICDVCRSGTRIPDYGLQYGRLEAQWGYGSQHDGEHYRVHLCEPCFFRVLSGLRRERMVMVCSMMSSHFPPKTLAWSARVTTGKRADG